MTSEGLIPEECKQSSVWIWHCPIHWWTGLFLVLVPFFCLNRNQMIRNLFWTQNICWVRRNLGLWREERGRTPREGAGRSCRNRAQTVRGRMASVTREYNLQEGDVARGQWKAVNAQRKLIYSTKRNEWDPESKLVHSGACVRAVVVFVFPVSSYCLAWSKQVKLIEWNQPLVFGGKRKGAIP